MGNEEAQVGVQPWSSPAPRRRRALCGLAVAAVVLAGLVGVPGSGGIPGAEERVADAVPVCALPRCKDVTVPLPAGVKVVSNKVRILLPKNYATSKLAYPVIYLLHGRGNHYTAGSQSTALMPTRRTSRPSSSCRTAAPTRRP